ncbi:helix-turn-helix domain-containing protein [Duganella callida]|uniref:AraC family transcriptional regulator n=1 Tax=Duganella callida TaxID=2561932 RepID=A0A4Y9SKH8_9BURK|nr:AraC family transcriptional regulator [Duganella callida]TFW23568.1 AraC family transcriptional regulator [Duganella callida]
MLIQHYPTADLTAELKPAPALTSTGRAWSGAVVNLHDWESGGHVVSPALDHDVLAMRVSGTVRLTQMRDGRTHTATVGCGNVTLHPRGMESRWQWDRPGGILLMRMPPALLQQAAEEITRAPRAATELQNCFGRKDLLVERIAQQFAAELRAPAHPAQAYIAQALSHALAAHLVCRFNAHGVQPQRQPNGLHPRVLQRLHDYVQAHMHDAIDLQALADVAHVSRFHFARLFRHSTGMSAMAYLETQRMQRAVELMRRGDLPLGEIALLAGYTEQSYFTKRFRLHHGMTPTAYLQRLRSRHPPG